jgi:hypothetical protein
MAAEATVEKAMEEALTVAVARVEVARVEAAMAAKATTARIGLGWG